MIQEVDKNGRRIPNPESTCKIFPGPKNRFWNEEKLMCYIILISIVLGYLLFMVNDATFLMEEWSILIPLVISMIFLSTVINQLMAAFRNPGIIQSDDFLNAIEPEGLDQVKLTSSKRDVLVPVKLNDGELAKLKFCLTCKIIRPPEAAHCKYCDICVYRQDHHCPYLGNCIGIQYYKNFYYFLLSVVLLTTLGGVFSFIHLFHLMEHFGGWKEAFGISPISLVVIIGSIAGGSFPLGLLCFHTFILFSGKTSRFICRSCSSTSDHADSVTRSPIVSLQRKNVNPFANCYHLLFTSSNSLKFGNNDFELVI